MADLRDSVNFDFRTDVDVAVGKAIKSMGPRKVIGALSLKITGNE